MPRLAMLIDEIGLAFDDLWSYYEVAGKPAWAVLLAALAGVTLLWFNVTL